MEFQDIDLVRTSHGPIGPVLDRLRVVLEPWLGRARFEQSPVAPELRFTTLSIGFPVSPGRTAAMKQRFDIRW